MSEIVAIVEGETEQTFVRDQVAELLGARGVAIWAVLPGRTRRKGGVKDWVSARRDIIYTLREGRYCTTMFDYYALPDTWPGRAEAKGLEWNQRSSHVESAVSKDIAEKMGDGFDQKYFIPYIQLHEFEALAFADVSQLAAVTAPMTTSSIDSLADRFKKMLDKAGDPEAINDGYETCPSRRIKSCVRAYQKRVHGPIVTRLIGLEHLRRTCSHFADWIRRLEQVSGPEP